MGILEEIALYRERYNTFRLSYKYRKRDDELCYTEANLQQILNHLHEYTGIDDRSLV